MSHDQIQQSPTRTLDGHVLPAPGVWDIDPGHTDLAFVGRPDTGPRPYLCAPIRPCQLECGLVA